MTRGNFFGAATSPPSCFSGAGSSEESVSSLSSDPDDAVAATALGRPRAAPDFAEAGFLPGDVAGLGRPLLLRGLSSRKVLSEAGTGARGSGASVCEESIEAKTSSVRASHVGGGPVWDARPPRRFFVAASSCQYASSL